MGRDKNNIVVLSSRALVEQFARMDGDILKPALRELDKFKANPRAAVVYNMTKNTWWWGDVDTRERLEICRVAKAVRMRR